MFKIIFVEIMICLVMLIGVAAYVFESLALHTIADRRGNPHAWLAWMPIGNL